MSYGVLRQHTLRFGYVRIKLEKRERYQYKRRNKKSSVAFCKTTVLRQQRN